MCFTMHSYDVTGCSLGRPRPLSHGHTAWHWKIRRSGWNSSRRHGEEVTEKTPQEGPYQGSGRAHTGEEPQ